MTVTFAPPATVAAPPRWPHQHEGLEFALARPATLMAIGMGGGKSRIAIDVAEHEDVDRVIVACPKSVLGVWPRELRKYATREWLTWNGLVHGARGPLRNPTVARRAAAVITSHADAIKLQRPLLIAVNMEAAWQGDMAEALLGTVRMAKRPLLIIDESHRIKSPSGKASKYLARLADVVRHGGGRVLLMTGTMMPHSPLDLYGQLRAIDPTILGTSYVTFRARYGQPKVKYIDQQTGRPVYLTTPGGQTIYEGVKDELLPELTRHVSPVVFQVDQDQIDRQAGLEKAVDVDRLVDLDAGTQSVYTQLERDGIAGVGTGVITAANAMVLAGIRLAQAANGYGKDHDTGREIALHDGLAPEKARVLADLLDDLPPREPVVVFARFHHDLDAIRRVADGGDRRYGEISGRRSDLTPDSTFPPDVDVLGVQLKSGGVGIDLTRARYCVFYSLDFSLGDYDQSRKRVHRPGQERRTVFIHLLAKGTVDHAIYGALKSRRNVVAAFVEHLTQKGTP